MKSGLRPTRNDHRDFDLLKSHSLTGVAAPTFPPEYSTENGLWTPDQAAFEPVFGNPALPYGCTDYTQVDLCADEDELLRDPMILEDITHANANGGGQIRDALAAAQKAFGWGPYFNVKPHQLDYFDTVRLAMLSGVPEKRSVSVGTPWFVDFSRTGSDGILPTPKDWSLIYATWHNHKICGWKQIDGSPYLITKSWQGKQFGDQGFAYISRALFNSLMAIDGTAAFTITRPVSAPNDIQTIDWTYVGRLLDFIKSLAPFSY